MCFCGDTECPSCGTAQGTIMLVSDYERAYERLFAWLKAEHPPRNETEERTTEAVLTTLWNRDSIRRAMIEELDREGA